MINSVSGDICLRCFARVSQIMKKIETIKMTREQEMAFKKKTAGRTGKYFWTALVFCACFQIYNICYTLQYTDFLLHTRPSRVYMCLYAALLSACLLMGILAAVWTFGKKGYEHRLLNLYMIFGCALVFWSVCLSIYDHRVSDNISIFVTSVVYVAGLLYMSPKISIPLYVISEIVLVTGIAMIEKNKAGDDYGSYVNSIALVIIAIFLSVYRWQQTRQEFLTNLLLEEKNREIMEQTEKLNFIAHHDTLTGIWNRNYLEQWKEKYFLSPAKERAVAVFMADIDHFKHYNDRFGHVLGDECLKRVAQTLKETGKEKGFLFRFGGEEFLYVLEGPQKDESRRLAEQMCTAVVEEKISSGMEEEGKEYVTVSIGYTEGVMRTDEEFRSLLRKADQALYYVKNSGRNRAAAYEELPEK